MKKIYVFLLVLGVVMTSCTLTKPTIDNSAIMASPQFKQGKFQNPKPLETMSLAKVPGFIKRYVVEKRLDAEPVKPVPLAAITAEVLAQLPADEISLFRLGHSSFLLKAEQKYWLIDPVFSERASPFSFMGPKRFHQTPISIEELPEITGVIISHNHYDHLDKASIKLLANKVAQFIVPLGVGHDLQAWGVKKQQIVELDWWHSHTLANVSLTLTPAQHFSGRSLTDSNDTLWGSWVIKTKQQSIFYSGDSGYFTGFKEIGEKYGPFDLTIIETGAYDEDWPDVHMTPEQSLQAHIDVNGQQMLPAHNGTFDLAFHPWYEPLERITALAKDAGIELVTPIVGEPIKLNNKTEYKPWWQGLN